MELILISAMTRERVIGRDRALPWSIPEEYAQFLDHVRGRPVLIGRSSYEIFGKDLGASTLLVISRSARTLPGAEVFDGLEPALERARAIGGKVFSAGGATIYEQTLPLADALYLSFVKQDHAGDTYFPEFDEAQWKVTRTEDHPQFEFRVYRRVSPSR